MIDLNITAIRESSTYRINAKMGKIAFSLKFDTGATDTVISARVFSNSLTDSDLE